MVRLNIQYRQSYPWQPTKPPIPFWLFNLYRDKWQEAYFGLAIWDSIACHSSGATLFAEQSFGLQS